MPFNHHHILHLLKNKELNELYATIAIRSFALALTGIFIPIFLYKLNYSLSAIFFFFALCAFFNLVFLIPVAKISSRIGLKHALLASMPPLIIFFLLMFSLERFNWPLYLLAIFIAMHTAFFWFSYHTDFSRFSKKKTRATQVGLASMIVATSSALGPILGGVILYFFGFKALFIIVSLLLLVSTFPLFLSREVHEPVKFSLQGFFRGQKLKDILGYMGNGIEVRIATILWPLFIFIFIFEEHYLSLGAVASLVFVSSIIATIFISKFSDISRRLVLKTGVVLNSLVWISKSFIVTPVQVFIADAFYGVTHMSMHVPFDALTYDKAKEKNRAKIIIQREMYIKIGALIFLLIMTVFSDYLIEAFRYGGPIASLMRFFF